MQAGATQTRERSVPGLAAYSSVPPHPTPLVGLREGSDLGGLIEFDS